ncbi:MAG: hypothetical protein WC606_05400 [Candidatus Absconditabacterales bacterium]
MGKFTQSMNAAALRTGNTIATPLRRGGEFSNALGNIPRQGYSSAKNVHEVTKQTRDALMDNFLNFSKVQGKWYQKMLKVPANLVSAMTRRPAMITGAGILSGFNQAARQPFKKLLYTPGKMFKGMRNATRLFSKEKGFDFAKYDTHETGGDTWINKIKEKKIGFLGAKFSAESEKQTEKKVKSKPVEDKKPEAKTEVKKEEIKKPIENPHAESELFQKKINEKDDKFFDKELAERGYPTGASFGSKPKDKPKSIKELQKKQKEESEMKDKAEHDKNFPDWKTLPDEFKKQYKKDYDKALKNNPTKEGIIARGKEAKMGEQPEEIVENFKKKDPTFAGYMEEILKK